MALSPKQQKALELLTCGQGLTYGEIARQVGCDVSTLRDWRNGEGFQEFKSELKRLNDIRWQAAEDAARQGAINLCKDGNQKMIEFVLKNVGYGVGLYGEPILPNRWCIIQIQAPYSAALGSKSKTNSFSRLAQLTMLVQLAVKRHIRLQ